MPPIDRILETAIYCDDLDKAEIFYTGLFGFPVMLSNERIRALDVNAASVLLLFQRGATTHSIRLPEGLIPSHDSTGPAHFAFGIAADQYHAWKAMLLQRGIAIESEVQWIAGGRSLYFRDPDGHSVELATPGLWRTW